MSITKRGRNTTNTLNCYFSQYKFSLWHIRLNMYVSETKFTSYKQCFLVFPSLEMQSRLMQSKVYNKLYYSVSTEAYHKHLKVAAPKKSFPSVFAIDTNCFDDCFLFYNWNSIFYTNLSLPKGLIQPPWCCVLWNKCFERSPHFTSIIFTIILQWYQRFKIKIQFLKNFSQKKLMADSISFTPSQFVNAPYFSL